MIHVTIARGCVLAAVLGLIGGVALGAGDLHRAPSVPNVIDQVVFEAGNWTPQLAPGSKGRSPGNHRAVVEVDRPGTDTAVLVTIPWRRQDQDPAAKSIVVVDAASGQQITNVLATRVENVSGDVVFQPNPGSLTYHVYYLPWESTGGPYPKVSYPKFVSLCEAAWEQRVRATPVDKLPRARTTHIQSVNAFHSFFPMEVIASESETATFLSSADGGWAVVPEHRDYPVRMRRFLPHHWTSQPPRNTFSSQALRGEWFTFQIAVVPGKDVLDGVRVAFDGLPAAWTNTFTCFNCGGTNAQGQPFTKIVSVPAGTVQPLWIGVRIPEDQRPGTITGDVTVSSAQRGSKRIPVSLDVQPALARESGFDTPELMTRLAWLNSTAGSDPEFIPQPYHPILVDQRTLSILGRNIQLSPAGLPEQMLSYFSPELTHLTETPQAVLARPIELEVRLSGGRERLQPSDCAVRQVSRGRVEWSAASRSRRVAMQVEGALEYDGMLDFRITVRALQDLQVDDIVLLVPWEPSAARYMLGLGFRGGRRPERVDWKWKVENHQEGVWLGGIHKGLQYVLRDDDYERPLNTNFYTNQPLRLPKSWCNGGRGGIRIQADDGAVTAWNYSGPRRMSAGETLKFNVRFLLTPFKPIDPPAQFRTRFVHRYAPVESVRAWGGTVVNIHHGNELNPYINYPFFNEDRLSAYVEAAHALGIKVKLYDTIRELSYRTHELFALRSLGDEILNDGPGGGHSWLQEHLEDHYHSAWHTPRVDDAAVLNKGTSRWVNYYIEGLSWLAAHRRIDGLYLDDIAFGRETMKRILAVLRQHRKEVIIDLHSANQFNPRDGFMNSALLYLEHFPFLSRLWFGEYFEYDRDADYWLTEVSGLPFGLMGEMLQDGGHPYRGLLYGMTTRLYGEVDPRPVWRLLRDFGIDQSRMQGYWLESPPITTSHPRILATTYVRTNAALVALASWSPRDERVSLNVDAGLARTLPGLQARAPAVVGLQAAAKVDLSNVLIPANQGLFVLLQPADQP